MKGYFITGTDTEVGKTVATVAWMRMLQSEGAKVAGMKPVASGCEQTNEGLRNSDALAIQSTSSTYMSYELVNPYCFESPIAPHIAAQQAGVQIDLVRILACAHQLAEKSDLLLVEGVGGWQVPLGASMMLPDLAKTLGLPVVLVVGLRLGCINHALLSIESIQRAGCELAGWIANHVDPSMQVQQAVMETLIARIKAPLIGVVPYADKPDMAAMRPFS